MSYDVIRVMSKDVFILIVSKVQFLSPKNPGGYFDSPPPPPYTHTLLAVKRALCIHVLHLALSCPHPQLQDQNLAGVAVWKGAIIFLASNRLFPVPRQGRKTLFRLFLPIFHFACLLSLGIALHF